MEIKDIKKLAVLSRINLSDKEEESLLKDMDAILGYVDQVKEAAATSAVVDMNNSSAPVNVFREDVDPHESGIFTEVLLNSAPERHGQYVKVKKIL